MIMVPAIEVWTYFFVLTKPRGTERIQEGHRTEHSSLIDSDDLNTPRLTMTVTEKIRYIPELMIYVIPLSLVYFFEYFVNQGLVSVRD